MAGHTAIFRNYQLGPFGVNRLRACGLATLLAIVMLPLAAAAQMTLISQNRTTSCVAEIVDDNTNEVFGWGDSAFAPDWLSFAPMLDAYASESFGYTDSEATQESTIDSTTFWLAGYAYTDAELFDPGYTANANALSHFEVEFSVDQPTNWSLDGTLESHANGLVELSLIDSIGYQVLFQSYAEMFPPLLVAESGTLAPGTYTLLITAECFDDLMEPGFYVASEASVDVQFSVTGGGTSAVGDNLTRGWYLNAGPNPMQNKTTIAFAGAPGRSVSLDVFDVRGRLVRRLQEAGGSVGRLAWDGRDGAGQSVPQGMYFVRMRDGKDFLQRKVTVIR